MIISNFFDDEKTSFEEYYEQEYLLNYPKNISKYEEKVDHMMTIMRGGKLIPLLKEMGFTDDIVSLGVGVGYLEHRLLKDNPHMRIVLSEYKQDFLDVIKPFFDKFFNVSFEKINLLNKKDITKIKAKNVLMHRVDCAFTNNQLLWIISAIMSLPATEKLLITSTSIAALRILLRNIRFIMKNLLNFFRQDKIFGRHGGYSRNQAEFLKFANKLNLKIKIISLKPYNLYLFTK